MTLIIPPIEDSNLPKSAPDFDFITDRLAVGNVASRAVPGFVAVVSLLSTAPWDELYGAPSLPLNKQGMPPLLHHIDINDGEGIGQDSLSEVTRFIAEGLARGCVLVHCGAGMSRSVAVVCAYLCRYAGMRWDEALALVKSRRPCAAPTDVFRESVTRWLQLDKLAESGPRSQCASDTDFEAWRRNEFERGYAAGHEGSGYSPTSLLYIEGYESGELARVKKLGAEPRR